MKPVHIVLAFCLAISFAFGALSCGEDAACNDTACDVSCHYQWEVKGLCVEGFCQCQGTKDTGTTPDGDNPFPTDDDDDNDDDDDTTDGDGETDGDGDDGDVTDKTWHDSRTGLTWQNPSTYCEMTWIGAFHRCDKLTLGGHDKWRLPTISELRTLLDGCPDTESHGRCGATDECTETSCLDQYCAGCTGDLGPVDGCYKHDLLQGQCTMYWTSIPTERNGLYWAVSSNGAKVTYAGDHFMYAVRCVSEKSVVDDVDDEDATDGDVADGDEMDGDEDAVTEGTWYDASSGLTWENPHNADNRSQSGAEVYCANLSLAGYDDWRLPTISELRSLIRGCPEREPGGCCVVADETCLESSCVESCTCCGEAHDNQTAPISCMWPTELEEEEGNCWYSYWSSSLVDNLSSAAWMVYFGSPAFISHNGIEDQWETSVRCVR